MESFFLGLSFFCTLLVVLVYRCSEWHFPVPGKVMDGVMIVERFAPTVLCLVGAAFALGSQIEQGFQFIRPVYDLLTAIATVALASSGIAYPFQGARTWIRWTFLTGSLLLLMTLVLNKSL